MTDDDGPTYIPHDISELTELAEAAYSPLSVVVDFNDLLIRFGQQDTFRLLTRLKDLLR